MVMLIFSIFCPLSDYSGHTEHCIGVRTRVSCHNHAMNQDASTCSRAEATVWSLDEKSIHFWCYHDRVLLYAPGPGSFLYVGVAVGLEGDNLGRPTVDRMPTSFRLMRVFNQQSSRIMMHTAVGCWAGTLRFFRKTYSVDQHKKNLHSTYRILT